MAANDWPDEELTQASAPPALDDVDDRAARLLAQVAAFQAQRQSAATESVDDDPEPEPAPEPEPQPAPEPQPEPEPELEPESEPEPVPQAGDEFGYTPADFVEVEPRTVETVTDSNVEPTDDDTGIEPSEVIWERLPPAPDDVTGTQEGRHRSARRMALPPWQASSASVFRQPETQPETEESPTPAPTPADEPDPQVTAKLPAPDPQAPATSGMPEGAPLAATGWPPPPGWPPIMPPLPPGWQGPPPWLPPPLETPTHALTNDQSPAAADPPRPGRHHAEPRRESTKFAALQDFRGPPSLDDAEVISRDEYVPISGWRGAVHKVTGGRVNPGVSRKEGELQELLDQIRQPIVGDFRIAVLSIKGGVGKTTTTLGLGSALAMVRADRVIAIDANPDRGTLAERVSDTSTSSTVRDLLRDPNIKRYTDVRNHTRLAPSRLEVLASEQDPAVSEIFGETDYRRTMEILRRFYNVILTDCGTGIIHSAMAGVLDLAQAIVLVSSPAIDAARSASATLDWLEQHGHGDLVREAHVVLSASHPGSPTLRLDKVFEHFEARCGSMHEIPFEPHLAEGADFDFDLLQPATTQAYLELAGSVAGKFSRLRSPNGLR